MVLEEPTVGMDVGAGALARIRIALEGKLAQCVEVGTSIQSYTGTSAERHCFLQSQYRS